MKKMQALLGWLYPVALVIVFLTAITGLVRGTMDWTAVFHLGYWMIPVATLAIISGQFDLLEKVRANAGSVSLQARLTDFVHWLMLVGIDIGTWMRGSASISGFILRCVLLFIIGWQVGVLVKRSAKVSLRSSVLPALCALSALGLGIASGVFRMSDDSRFGYGWAFETLTAFVAIGLVGKFIWDDTQTMREKGAAGYPRSLFLKGMFCNALVVWFWAHTISQGGFRNGTWWLENLGISFVTIVGNVIYFGYWRIYEHYRAHEPSRQ